MWILTSGTTNNTYVHLVEKFTMSTSFKTRTLYTVSSALWALIHTRPLESMDRVYERANCEPKKGNHK